MNTIFKRDNENGDVMAFTIIVILTWLVGTTFYLTPKKLSFLQNSIVFMLVTILSRNLMTILTMELKWIETSQEPLVYMFFVLEREVVTPIAVLLFINLYDQLDNPLRKISCFLGILIGIHSLDYLSVYLDVVEYKNWNYFYSILQQGIYLILGLGFSKLVQAKGVKT